MENKKITISTVIAFILLLWEVIAPQVEIIFGIGSKEVAIIGVIITAISFAYNYFYPQESLFKTAYRVAKESIGGGGVKKPDDK